VGLGKRKVVHCDALKKKRNVESGKKKKARPKRLP